MTRIILRGCLGRMGQEITRLVNEDAAAQIVAGIAEAAVDNSGYPVFKKFADCNIEADVIIDFSSPLRINEMLEYSIDRKLPIVLCTTGLSEDDLKSVNDTSNKVAILRSANMSLGVNTVIQLLKIAAKSLASADFDIEIVEKHHNQKVDAPSGTALALADSMNEVLEEKYEYNFDRSQIREKRQKKEIGISAVRGGTIVGEHEVIFAGLDEVIEIKHTAYSRAIFAKGAIQAAKFLKDKNPGMYQMGDLVV
ncbi:MAG: dapB [Anaerocolumna sp.]|jgi:4-hydroxy-tetrahydrodipicolinate reductase|nr:dapB [Anaerocolumna sp.]